LLTVLQIEVALAEFYFSLEEESSRDSCSGRVLIFEERSIFRTGMHCQMAIRFYEIHTPLTEAVLPDSGVHCYFAQI
jgi:hypothetical protein